MSSFLAWISDHVGNLITITMLVFGAVAYSRDTRGKADVLATELKRQNEISTQNFAELQNDFHDLSEKVINHQAQDSSEFRAIRDALAAQELRMAEDLSATKHEFGETVSAAREKMNLDAMFVRDNFVKRDSFAAVVADMSARVERNATEIKEWLLRIDNKLDNKADKGNSK